MHAMTREERRQTLKLIQLEEELLWAKSELKAAQVRLDRVQREYDTELRKLAEVRS